MKTVSTNLKKMPRSGIRVIMDLAAQQDQAFHLELGEPGFSTPHHIREAAVQAIHDGFTKYTPNVGLLSLRKAIVEKVKTKNGIAAKLNQVGITSGAGFALISALITVANSGDEVLIPDPGWSNYNMEAIITGLTPVFYPLKPENGFQPDIEDIEPLIGTHTRAIMMNTPANPTGAVFSEKTVRSMVELARRYDIYLISDEVYEDFVYQGCHHSAAVYDKDHHVISIFSVSKTYAMTGWRIGYYVAPEEIAPEMQKVLEPYISNAASVSQKAAEAAIAGPQDCIAEMAEAYRQRRDLVVEILHRDGYDFFIPEGAFYLMLDISQAGMDSYTFAKELVQKTGVAVAPGRTFGPNSDHLIRLSFCANPDELQEGMKRLCRFLAEKCRG